MRSSLAQLLRRVVALGVLWLMLGATGVAQEVPRVIHVFVALADNKYQGIVPVPAALGNGDDPGRNLYWGAGGGVKTFFAKSKEWELIGTRKYFKLPILERCIFKHRTANVYLVADAYEGAQIKLAIQAFLAAAAGEGVERIAMMTPKADFNAGGAADVVAYVGHDGLMDFSLSDLPRNHAESRREAIILACASKQYFAKAVRTAGATPLLWTTNLMAPEAYTLKAALDGWIAKESAEQIRQRAAEAYAKYQKCSVKAARGLLVTGW